MLAIQGVACKDTAKFTDGGTTIGAPTHIVQNIKGDDLMKEENIATQTENKMSSLQNQANIGSISIPITEHATEEDLESHEKEFNKVTIGTMSEHSSVMQIEDLEPAEKVCDKLIKETMPGYKDEWSICIENRDIEKAYSLLENALMPNELQLQRVCETFDSKSKITKIICEKMEDIISDASCHIIYTEACYREKDPSKIVFVVYTTGPVDDIDSAVGRYSVVRRSFDCGSQEGNDVIDREMQEDLHFDDSESEDIEQILKEHSPKLMKKHSNLTLTTASNLKSKDYSNFYKTTCLEQKACIVFNVTCKGLIPVGEDVLPRKLGSYDTDVREGRLRFAVGGPPGGKHKKIKIGCRISSKQGSGTIGGFVQHPDHGVCAITCSHIVLSNEEMLSFKKGKPNSPLGRICFQPDYRKRGEEGCGKVVLARFEEGNETKAGIDVALVKIDEDRIPTTGDFPDVSRKGLKGCCSHFKDDLLKTKLSYKSGMILESDEIHLQNFVVKYGQKTGLTLGRLRTKGGSARYDIPPDMNKENGTKSSKLKRYSFTLHGLFEVNGIGSRFAEPGDSGSLVFSRDENNKLSAVGILVGGDTKSTFMQPICSIFEAIGMQRPFNMMNFDPRDRRIEALEKNVEKIVRKLDIQ